MSDDKKKRTRNRDALDDVLRGFRLWLEAKTSRLSLDDDDEQFVRWVEAGPAKQEDA